MIRVAITTLGCKVNHFESAAISEAVAVRGHGIVPFENTADVYVINTCTVTGNTDYQSRQLIRRAWRRNPAASIIVTGCYAQTSPDLLATMPGVTFVVGTGDKKMIPDLIGEATMRHKRVIVSPAAELSRYSHLPLSRDSRQTRAFLKIQDGCHSFCSYCIIPYARGPSRSLAEATVIDQVRALKAGGHREIVLTGIHLGMYGLDLRPATDLVRLLRRIEEETDVERLRISSIEPMEVTDELIDRMESSRILCRHLHIPLQSGCDRILSAMNRNYDTDRFRRRLEDICRAIPGVGVGIDVMAGFPGEGEDEFLATREFVDSLSLSYLHVFPYSRRPGTVAAGLPCQTEASVIKERARILREIGFRKRRSFNESFRGKVLTVLVEEKRDRKAGFFRGYSDNYIPVLIENGTADMTNRIMAVEATGTRDNSLVGRAVIHG
ncbi:MAG: tRNA (N(6)-L-threonylcarbamoyladenosine(37)-C(2))-methylthiotransferase MtaB [Deltaproteobacteria bacterium]|nr:tRNA (N(6)-L-threonylcarbamoyladenosine(37)-C(2))-methylthiotransferase MtaB [Deltaproteobacteria bacterium]